MRNRSEMTSAATVKKRKTIKRPLAVLATVVIAALLIIGIAIIVIDPFLHFHGPIKGLQYSLLDERYENDGIARHYDYEAMITGTSMTQNFKASQMEKLWGVETIKTSFSGASYHELTAHMERAIGYNPGLKYIVCSLDGSRLFTEWDWNSYPDIPEYLYDDKILNDVNYIWNKDVIVKAINNINYTRAGNKTPDMDEYGAWYKWADFSEETAMSAYVKQEFTRKTVLSEDDIRMIEENISNNYLRLANENPDVTFYFFLPPYSSLYWKNVNEKGELIRQTDGEKYAISLLLTAPNIEVYGFEGLTDITTDLDNYQDTLHYGPWINEKIMNDIHDGNNRLTPNNYEEYFEHLKEIYRESDGTSFS